MLRALRRQRGSFEAALLAMIVPAMPAWAQVEPTRLTYRAPPGCPDAGRFREDVAARTGPGGGAQDKPGRTFVVTVTAEGNVERGILAIVNADGAVSTREVVGGTCGEVVSALALMTALAIDPAAPRGGNGTAPPDSAASVPRVAASAARAVPPELPSVNPPPSFARERPPASLPSSAFASDSLPPGRSSGRWRWSIGADGLGMVGLAPGLSVGGGAFVDLTDEAPGPAAPSLRTTLYGVTSHATFVGPIGTRLDWFAARFEVCPLRLSASIHVAFVLCAALDVGVLRSDGTGLASNTIQVRGWLAPSALGRVAWSGRGPFFVEGGAGLTAPVTHYVLYYQPTATLDRAAYTLAPVGATASMGAGYRFP